MLNSLSVGENDARKTKAQLVAELAGARQRVSQLEVAEVIGLAGLALAPAWHNVCCASWLKPT